VTSRSRAGAGAAVRTCSCGPRRASAAEDGNGPCENRQANQQTKPSRKCSMVLDKYLHIEQDGNSYEAAPWGTVCSAYKVGVEQTLK